MMDAKQKERLERLAIAGIVVIGFFICYALMVSH